MNEDRVGTADVRRRRARARPALWLALAATLAGAGSLQATAATAPPTTATAPPTAAALGAPGLNPLPTAAGAGRIDVALLESALRLGRPAAAPSAATRVALNTAVLSGLPWRSGSSCPEKGLAEFRGRALDANVVFVSGDSWDGMVKQIRQDRFRAAAAATPLFVVSLGLLPKAEDGQHARCAAGEFDARFTEIGSRLASVGAGQGVVRLGWEATQASRPWGVRSVAGIPDYVGCFRRAAAALKSAAPGLTIEWSVGRSASLPINVMDMYPGDEAVDVIGLHYYDNVSPKIRSQAYWNQHYSATLNGGPRGLGTWLATAKAHGKKLAVPEWGVWNQGNVAKADNAVYVENMYRFFQDNAADLAYENYYSCPLAHRLYPQETFPLARAKYRELWSAGR